MLESLMADGSERTLRLESLQALIEREGALEPAAACRIVQQLARQIARLHAADLWHGAVTSSAVTLTPSGSVQLTPRAELPDAALAEAQGFWPADVRYPAETELPESLTAARGILQKAGESADPVRIDLYQLGALLCRLATGDPVSAYLRSPRTRGRVPRDLQPVLDRTLGFAADDRFTTAEQLAECLLSLLPETAAGASSAAASGSNAGSSLPEKTPPPPTAKPADAAAADTSPSVISARPEPDTSVGPVRPSALSDQQATAGSPGDPPLPFTRLAHYEVREQIGRGGMGDVYKAYESVLDRTVAIKVLPADFCRQEEFVRRFYAEATAAARLSHPNIIDIYYIGEDQNHHFFSMQYVEGESLAQLLARQGRLNIDQTLSIVIQALAGLAAAHRQGMVHRDIKPGNILLDRENRRALVADFGLVKSLQGIDSLTATGVVVGTVDYIAPEQGRGLTVDARSDLYSVGVLLYRMLSGRLPFEADSPTAMIFQHVYETPERLSLVAPDVPAVLSAAVDKLLAKSPDDRYQTALGLLADLKACRENRPLPSGVDVISLDDDDSGIIALEDSPSLVVEAPSFEVEPDLPGDLEEAAPTGFLQRQWNRLVDAVEERAPEFVDYLQNTQQQVDHAVAEYERRRNALSELAREAQSVLAELKLQAESWRTAACENPAAEDSSPGHRAQLQADEIDTQVAVQEEQLESIRLQLDRVTARLEQLRSQRDLLKARLEVARVRVRLAGGQVAKRRVPFHLPRLRWNWKIQSACVALSLFVIAGVAYRIYHLYAPQPVVEQPSEEVLESADTADEINPAVSREGVEVRHLPLRQFEGHVAHVSQATYSPDGRYLASLDNSGHVRVRNTHTGETVLTVTPNTYESVRIKEIAFSHSSLLLGTSNGVWDIESGTRQIYLPKSDPSASSKLLGFSSDDASLILMETVKDAATLVYHPLRADGKPRRIELGGDDESAGPVSSYSVDLSSDGRLLAFHGTDRQIHLWDLETGREHEAPEFPPAAPLTNQDRYLLRLSSNGRLLAGVVRGTSSLTVWNVASGQVVDTVETADRVTRAPVWDSDGRVLAINAGGETVEFWDSDTKSFRLILQPGVAVEDMAFSPDDQQILLAGADPYLTLWNARLGPMTVPRAVMPTITDVIAFPKRDRLLCAGGNVIGTWNMDRPDRLLKFAEFQGNIITASLSSDGRLAVAGGSRGTLCLFDVIGGRLLR